MDCNIRDVSNAVMIDSLDTIIEQENRKLEMDKNTGLLAKKTKVLKAQQKPLKENENIASQNTRFLENSKSQSPKLSPSRDRFNEIEKLANSFTRSSSFFTTNNNNNNINVNHSHKNALLKGTMTTQTHNEFDRDKVSTNNNSNNNLVSPDFKVKRNVRFGEFSPFNPANQVTSHPFLGIGEYDDKRKKIQELQRKEYLEYLSKAKRDKNISDLPKLPGYSCEEAFKTAMEDNNTEQIQLNKKVYDREDLIQVAPFNDGVESCGLDDVQKKEMNRLKQELYRLELNKQIEEKKKLELERKQKEQMDDEAIERAARDQEEKIKKEFEKESEKRILAQLQKQLQQEKLKNELMRKQRDLEKKSLNVTSEKISPHVSMHTPDCHESFEDDDVEVFHCPPPQSPFDNTPLPTTRNRVPRKVVYDEEIESVNKTNDVSCNTDTFSNLCKNENISFPITKQQMEKTHVSFARESPLKRNEYNPVAQLPVSKTLIIDSPLKLAGLYDCKENRTCEATETVNRNQVSQEVLIGSNHELLTDKHLLSNLGTIRKQLIIEHQKLKQQLRLSE